MPPLTRASAMSRINYRQRGNYAREDRYKIFIIDEFTSLDRGI